MPLPVPAPKSPSAASLTKPSTNRPSPKTEVRPDVRPDVWSESEIADAKRQCQEALKSMSAVFEPLPPVKKGRCGAPAPIRLVSIGKQHPVKFQPAPTVSCRMLKPLKRWIDTALQPRAAKYLEARVTSVSVMSSYSCRTRYGRKGARMSEHAFANALDVGGFQLADGRRVSVLKDWGLTRRDIVKIAERAQQNKAAKTAVSGANGTTARPSKPALRAAGAANRKLSKSPQTALPPVHIRRRTPAAASGGAPDKQTVERRQRSERTVRIVTLPASRQSRSLLQSSRRTATLPAAPANAPVPRQATQNAVPPLPTRRPLRKAIRRRASLGQVTPKRIPKFKTPPFRLGGPKPSSSKPRALFLRGIHRSACRIFGTTLGPEANEAHRNHFHFDMFPRRRSKYCE